MNGTSCVPDLSTTYLGMRLRSPIVASAGPLTGDPECWEALEAAGAGAIVLPSLFEEEIEREAFALEAIQAFGAELSESSSHLPQIDSAGTADRYLTLVELAKGALAHTRSLDMGAAFDALVALADDEGVTLGVATRQVMYRARSGTLDARPTGS